MANDGLNENGERRLNGSSATEEISVSIFLPDIKKTHVEHLLLSDICANVTLCESAQFGTDSAQLSDGFRLMVICNTADDSAGSSKVTVAPRSSDNSDDVNVRNVSRQINSDENSFNV